MKSILVFMLELIYIVRINTSKENYDADYEASRIQTFISNLIKTK